MKLLQQFISLFLFRILLGIFSYNYNNQFKWSASIVLALVFRSHNTLVVLLIAMTILASINIHIVNYTIFGILVVITAISTRNVLEKGTYEYVVVDNISNNYVIWDLKLPVNFGLLKTFQNVNVYDVIDLEKNQTSLIDNKYYNSLGIQFQTDSKILNTSESILSDVIKFKNKLKENLDLHLSNKNSNLIKGFLFGGSDLTDKELKDNLRTLGLSHIVSVSGFNFAIIQSALLTLNVFLKRRILNLITTIFFVLFYLFIGILNLSAFRAMIMILLISASAFSGRPTRFANSIILAILALSVILPTSVLNLSFLLSLSVTIGLTLSNIKSTRMNLFLNYLITTTKVSAVAFMSTLPILAINFTDLSWGDLFLTLYFYLSYLY